MSKIYTVGLYLNQGWTKYSVTVRSLERNRHWKRVGNRIYDTARARATNNIKLFDIEYQASQADAELYAAGVVTALNKLGLSRIYVKA
jgi:hypothetical protein